MPPYYLFTIITIQRICTLRKFRFVTQYIPFGFNNKFVLCGSIVGKYTRQPLVEVWNSPIPHAKAVGPSIRLQAFHCIGIRQKLLVKGIFYAIAVESGWQCPAPHRVSTLVNPTLSRP